MRRHQNLRIHLTQPRRGSMQLRIERISFGRIRDGKAAMRKAFLVQRIQEQNR